jgi:WD40 repeat protein
MSAVYDIVFHPNGAMLASSASDTRIILWDVETGNRILELDGQPELYRKGLGFSPDGKLLASGHAGTGEIALWDVTTGAKTLTMQFEGWVVDVAFTPDGTVLGVGSNSPRTGVKLWDVATGAEIRTHLDVLYPIVFQPSGDLLAVNGNCRDRVGIGLCDPAIVLFDANTGDEALTIASNFAIGALAFSPDGTRLAADVCARRDERRRCIGKDVKLWEVTTGEEVRTYRVDEAAERLEALAFSPDGSLLAGALNNGMVQIWEVSSGREVRAYQPSSQVASDVAFSPNGRYLASSSWDGLIRLWYVGDLSGP